MQLLNAKYLTNLWRFLNGYVAYKEFHLENLFRKTPIPQVKKGKEKKKKAKKKKKRKENKNLRTNMLDIKDIVDFRNN